MGVTTVYITEAMMSWIDYSVLPYCQNHNPIKVYLGLVKEQKYFINLMLHLEDKIFERY